MKTTTKTTTTTTMMMMRSRPMDNIQSPELKGVLLLGVDATRVNDLMAIQMKTSRKDLKKDFQVFQEAVTPKLPPLATKYMTWKTVPVLQNVVVGCEPDESDYYGDDDDYNDGNDSDEMSNHEGSFVDLLHPSYTSDTDFSSSSSSCIFSDADADAGTDGLTTISRPRGSGLGHDILDDDDDEGVAVVPAERPLLTYPEEDEDEDEDHQNYRKERLVIFVNNFFEIRRSPIAGWGAFARKKLHQGDKILVEKALYHATHEQVEACVAGLTETERKIAHDLHTAFFHGGGGNGETTTKAEAIWSTNAFASIYPKDVACSAAAAAALRKKKKKKKKKTPCRHDVAGLFPVAARFNHSCEPQIQYKYESDNEVLVFTVRSWEIAPGEELTISYGKDPSVLYHRFGFSCACGYCRGFDPSKWDY